MWSANRSRQPIGARNLFATQSRLMGDWAAKLSDEGRERLTATNSQFPESRSRAMT